MSPSAEKHGTQDGRSRRTSRTSASATTSRSTRRAPADGSGPALARGFGVVDAALVRRRARADREAVRRRGAARGGAAVAHAIQMFAAKFLFHQQPRRCRGPLHGLRRAARGRRPSGPHQRRVDGAHRSAGPAPLRAGDEGALAARARRRREPQRGVLPRLPVGARRRRRRADVYPGPFDRGRRGLVRSRAQRGIAIVTRWRRRRRRARRAPRRRGGGCRRRRSASSAPCPMATRAESVSRAGRALSFGGAARGAAPELDAPGKTRPRIVSTPSTSWHLPPHRRERGHRRGSPAPHICQGGKPAGPGAGA